MKDICKAIIAGYAAGKSGLDDDMVQHLIDLGDRAEFVIEALDARDMLQRYLGEATAEITQLKDALRAAVAHVETFTGDGCRKQPPQWAMLPNGDFNVEEISKRARALLHPVAVTREQGDAVVLIARFDTIAEAEDFLGTSATIDPDALEAGDYSIDAPETMVNPRAR